MTTKPSDALARLIRNLNDMHPESSLRCEIVADSIAALIDAKLAHPPGYCPPGETAWEPKWSEPFDRERADDLNSTTDSARSVAAIVSPSPPGSGEMPDEATARADTLGKDSDESANMLLAALGLPSNRARFMLVERHLEWAYQNGVKDERARASTPATAIPTPERRRELLDEISAIGQEQAASEGEPEPRPGGAGEASDEELNEIFRKASLRAHGTRSNGWGAGNRAIYNAGRSDGRAEERKA